MAPTCPINLPPFTLHRIIEKGLIEQLLWNIRARGRAARDINLSQVPAVNIPPTLQASVSYSAGYDWQFSIAK